MLPSAYVRAGQSAESHASAVLVTTAVPQSNSPPVPTGYFPVDIEKRLILVIEDEPCLILISQFGPTGSIGQVIRGKLGFGVHARRVQWTTAAGLLISTKLDFVLQREGSQVALSYPVLEPVVFARLVRATGARLQSSPRTAEGLIGSDYLVEPAAVRGELLRISTLSSSSEYQTTQGASTLRIVKVCQDYIEIDLKGIPLENQQIVVFQMSGSTTQVPVRPLEPRARTFHQETGATTQSIQFPQWIRVNYHRQTHRREVGVDLTVCWRHPLWPEIIGSGIILNISASGLALSSTHSELLVPGLVLLVRIVDGFKTTSVRVRVAYSRASQNEEDLGFVGLQVETASTGELFLWSKFVQRYLYETSQIANLDLWEVYEKSGYLALSQKSPGDFKHLRKAFEECTARLAQAPELACLRRWPRAGPARAGIAHARIYGGTWFLYQVAKIRGEVQGEKDGRRAIYQLYVQAYEHALTCGGAKWLWSFVQDQASPLSHLIHRDAPATWFGSSSYVYRFRALEIQVESAVGRVSILKARAVQRKAIDSFLRSTYSSTYLSALELLGDAQFAQTVQLWANAGLKRERFWFVVQRQEHPVLAVVLETAPAGLHLYGLLDCMRVYAMEEPTTAELQSAVAGAQQWFTERSRSKFVWHVEDALMSVVERLPLEQLSARDMGFATASILPIARVPMILDLLHSRLQEGHERGRDALGASTRLLEAGATGSK